MPLGTNPALVDGPPRLPLPFGLFSAFTPREDAVDRWRMSVQWEPLTCAPAGLIADAMCTPDDGEGIEGLPKEFDRDEGDLGGAVPFTVYGWHVCSPIGSSAERAQELADEHLINREEHAAERALWNGLVGVLPNFTEDADDIGEMPGDTRADIEQAVAEAEQWMGDTYGSLGVLHMSRRHASLLKPDVRGGRMFTRLGTPIVAGSGYGEDAIIVTSPLIGYRGSIETSSATPYDLLDRAQNDLYAVAERQYLIAFDTCGFGRVSLTRQEA